MTARLARALVAALVVATVAGGVALPLGGHGVALGAEPLPLFGTLATDESVADGEYAAGVRLAHVDLAWDRYEPSDGAFDAAYADSVRDKVTALQAAGLRVVVGLNVQRPPAWVFAYANSQYVDQYGTAAADAPNLTFSRTLRMVAERYIARVAQDLDPTSFWAVRIGSGGDVETLYPPESDSRGHGNAYWAYDASAQGGPDRPASIPPSPYPGWKPGDRTYQGRPFSSAQVQEWFDWYLGAMVDGVNWQITTYKALGYTGQIQVLMPGVGRRPGGYLAAIESHLDGGGDENGTMGRGAVWHKVIDGLADRTDVVVYVSSVADGSGHDDGCQPDDGDTSLDDPIVDGWSATRWLSYNADRYGMAKAGENPGQRDQPRLYGVGMLEASVRQMQGCGFESLMWAHDFNLYGANAAVTLADYARVIAAETR